MKNVFKLFGAIPRIAIIAMLAIIGFSFVSCDDGSVSGGNDTSRKMTCTSDDSDGNNYSLTVTGKPSGSAYTPQNGDLFTLVIKLKNGPTKTSTGTVVSAAPSGSGGRTKLTLKVYEVTYIIYIYIIRDDIWVMTDIDGNIPITSSTDNDTEPLILIFKPLKPVKEDSGSAVIGVILDKVELALKVEETAALAHTVIPTNAANQSVTWSSSNTAVATVSQTGLVTGVSKGSATIRVTTEDGGKSAICNVTITDGEEPGRKMDCTSDDSEGNRFKFEIIEIPGPTMNWPKTGDTFTLDVIPLTGPTRRSTGTIYEVDITNGRGWIWFTVGGTRFRVYIYIFEEIWVINRVWGPIIFIDNTSWDVDRVLYPWAEGYGSSVIGVILNKTDLSLEVGGTETLVHTVIPTNAANRAVTWSSSNTAVATVSSSGAVRGVSAGSATIRVTTSDGNKAAICNVIVTSGAAVEVASVTLNRSALSLAVGGTETLQATVLPANATNKAVSWSSSNTAIATVTQTGLVTAVSAGSATIRVTTADGGKTAACALTVTGIEVASVSLNKSALSLTVGGTETLTATVLPANAANKAVTWSSSENGVATVSQTGLVTALSAGSATIRVTTADGGKTAACAVTVTSAQQSGPTCTSKDDEGYEYEWTFDIPSSTPNYIPKPDDPYTMDAGPGNGPKKRSTGKIILVNIIGDRGTIVFSSGGYTFTVYIYIIREYVWVITRIWGDIVFTDNTRWTDWDRTLDPVVNNAGREVIGVILDKVELTLDAGGTATLKHTVIPTNATNKAVTWSSNENGIATVSQTGLVTGVSAGSATIKVTTTDGNKQAICNVTVRAANQTPVIGDYNIEPLYGANDIPYAVSITPKQGKSTGAVTVWYEGINVTYPKSQTFPSAVGEYAVSFDVAAASGWNAATGIVVGKIIIENAAGVPTFDDAYDFGEWLKKQPDNMAATAYEVKLNFSYGIYSSIGSILKNYPDKYVSLDFTGSTFTTIDADAFYDCTSLVGIIIQNSVTSIGSHAFNGCTYLRYVTIGNGVKSIGDNAFKNCFPGNGINTVIFKSTIPSSGFNAIAFPDDLRDKFYATDATNGTPGTYTAGSYIFPTIGEPFRIWTKQ